MRGTQRKAAVVLTAASAIYIGAFAGTAFAESDADKIRSRCIDEVVKAYPDPSPDLQEARMNHYIACMQRNGQQP